MKTVDYSNTVITGGLWNKKQEMLRSSTVYAVYNRFKDTGRFDAFRCDWKEDMPNKPHIFWDSDVAKWIEGVAYLTRLKPEPELEKIVDTLVDLIEKNRSSDGYFNSYFIVVEPGARFTRRGDHELYCAGHLIEAAVAYFQATGKRKFLDLMCDYADYIENRFKIRRDTAFVTPGHEEIELALFRLYECTGERRYLELSEFFINNRGQSEETANGCLYNQSHKPVREQFTAEGHAVRAVYLYCGMADIALETGDEKLKTACELLFDNIINKRMYITGGIGSSNRGEAFTVDYDLPNLLAYTETCAALGLALFANRMLRFGADSKYSDIIERIIYNGFLSSVSLDGKSFYYTNPLELIPELGRRNVSTVGRDTGKPEYWAKAERSEVFNCSCCPPNIVRFIPSIANMLYTDDGETLFVHQFMQSKTVISRNGKTLHIEQKTAYPENGRVKIKITGGDTAIAVRIPGWYHGYTGETVRGYAYFSVKDGETLSFDFRMKARIVEAKPDAVFDCGRYAVAKGPVIYCMESLDNGDLLRDIRLDRRAKFVEGRHTELDVPMLTVKAYRRKSDENTPLYSDMHDSLCEIEAKLIPYYAFANRQPCEMQVWHFVR